VINAQTEPDASVQIFGRELPHPIMIAPARQADIHPEGELATVRGAGECGAVTIVSNNATKTIEEIAAAASQPVWHQAYLYKDRERSRDNIQRAEAAGYQAICVTVDSSSNGPRDQEYRYRPISDPGRFRKHPANIWSWPTTWDDFEWYRSLTKLPVIPKGILTAEDAVRSFELGADGVYISNHGGRNFDSGVATIQVLPAIAEVVAGRGPIIIDGGIRRGVDVLKALTLGATAVAVGRPFLYGLAVDGADGVAAVINMLWNELDMALISTGQHSIANLDKSALLPTPHAFFSS
jgi:4-hydroxymandelate oxidase